MDKTKLFFLAISIMATGKTTCMNRKKSISFELITKVCITDNGSPSNQRIPLDNNSQQNSYYPDEKLGSKLHILYNKNNPPTSKSINAIVKYLQKHVFTTQNERETIRLFITGNNISVLAGHGFTFKSSLLHQAAYCGSLNAIGCLLQFIENPNIKDTKGNTPLIYACQKNYKITVEKLLAKGAQPTIRNNDGFTAFHYAQQNNSISHILYKAIHQ